MTAPHGPDSEDGFVPNPIPEDADTVLTTPEDVASAGRSCMAIIVLGTIIVLLLLFWLAFRTLGGA